MKQHKKWYDNRFVTHFWLVVFWPVGLYALWKSNTIAKWWKITVSGGISLFIMVIIISVSSASEINNDLKNVTVAPPARRAGDEYKTIIVKPVKIPSDVKWEIIKAEADPYLKKSMLQIKLSRKVSKKVLNKIAEILYEPRKEFERVFIFYHIEGMDESSLAWAITHFTPDLDIQILGSSLEEEQMILAAADSIDQQIIGKWKSEKSLMGAVLVLFRNREDKLIMRTIWKSGSEADELITTATSGGKTRYNYDNTHGEYYILEPNGNLGMYGESGKFDEAVRLD